MNSLAVWLRGVALFFVVTLTALAVLTGRAVSEGERDMAQSDAAFDRGDLERALLFARRAATWYAPGAPHVGAAYQRMVAIAEGSERSRDFAQARAAYGAIRGSALETRHLWVPYAEPLERANRELARLAAIDAADRPAAAEAAMQQLSRNDGPRSGWIFVLALGFALLIAGMLLFALRGVSAAGRLRLTHAIWATGLLLLGAACWTLAVIQA